MHKDPHKDTPFISQLKNLNAPLMATIFITERCNLACRHCIGSYGHKFTENELSLQSWMNIIDDLKEYVITIEVSGGEPFFSQKTLHLLQHIKESKFSVMSITTNGTLITEGVAWMLSKLRPELQIVRVSLEGAGPEVHECLSGKGTYGPAIRGIKHLCDNNIPVVVNTAIHKGTTFEDVEKMYGLAEEFGFDVHYGPIYPVGEALKNWKLTLLPPAVLNELSGFIVKKEMESSIDDRAIKTHEQMRQEENVVKRTLDRCGAGYRGIAIMSNGKIAACHLLSLNQSFESILNIWKNSRFLKKLRDYRREDDAEICQKCKERSSCFKYCIGASYRVFGDFRAPSPYCILYHEYLDLDESIVAPYSKILERSGIRFDQHTC